jgi:hypothetical protein
MHSPLSVFTGRSDHVFPMNFLKSAITFAQGKITSVLSTLNLHPGAKYPVCFASINSVHMVTVFFLMVYKDKMIHLPLAKIIKGFNRKILKQFSNRYPSGQNKIPEPEYSSKDRFYEPLNLLEVV